MKILVTTLVLLGLSLSASSYANHTNHCEWEQQQLDHCLGTITPVQPTIVRYYCVCEVQNWWANLNYYAVMSNGENRFMHTLEAFTAVGGCQEALRTNPSCR